MKISNRDYGLTPEQMVTAAYVSQRPLDITLRGEGDPTIRCEVVSVNQNRKMVTLTPRSNQSARLFVPFRDLLAAYRAD